MVRRSLSAGEKCLKTGLWGSIIAVICCFTPALVIALGFLGLAALTPYLDYILMPLLAVFIILALYGWTQRKEQRN
jgi:mercuric ion transport protein